MINLRKITGFFMVLAIIISNVNLSFAEEINKNNAFEIVDDEITTSNSSIKFSKDVLGNISENLSDKENYGAYENNDFNDNDKISLAIAYKNNDLKEDITQNINSDKNIDFNEYKNIVFDEAVYYISNDNQVVKFFNGVSEIVYNDNYVIGLFQIDNCLYAATFNADWQEENILIERIPNISLHNEDDNTISLAATNESVIYDFLINNLGLNNASACGILANIYSESSFNPQASCIDTNGLTSYGICQWNGGRFTSLKNYCANNGYSYSSLTGQLHYLQHELNNGYKKQYNYIKNNIQNTSQGAYDAGYYWASKFEVCASKYWVGRGNIALNTYWPRYAGHTHNYITEYEAVHPHRVYKKCTSCGETSYTGKTATMPGCVACSCVNLGDSFNARIIQTSSGRCVTNDNNHANVYPPSGAANQAWVFVRQTDGSYKITSTSNGAVLDVYSGETADGTVIWLWEDNASPAQRWFVCGSKDSYTLVSALDMSKVLDVNGDYYDKKGTNNVHLWTNNDTPAQKFKIQIDRKAPSITNYGIKDVTKDGYTAYGTVTDDLGITEVVFGVKIGNGNWSWLSPTSKSGNTYYCKVKTSKAGNYITIIDAYDVVTNGTRIYCPEQHIDKPAPKPTISVTPYVGGKTISISTNMSNTGGEKYTIYYTTNGNTPTEKSTKYTGPFNITSTKTVKVIAVSDGWTASSVASSNITVSQTEAPVIKSENITGGKKITLLCDTKGSEIHYTTDGSTPTLESKKYTKPFNITSTKTIRAKAFCSGYTKSAITDSVIKVTQTSAPIIKSENAANGKEISLSCQTSGSVIYYTTDGSTPTASSTKYTGAFNLTSSKTVKAIAVCNGYANSSVTSTAITVTKTYIVKYDANGGSGAPAAQTKYSDNDLTLSNITPTKDGNKFLGWHTSALDTGLKIISYNPGDVYNKNADLTLYAVWENEETNNNDMILSSSGGSTSRGGYIDIPIVLTGKIQSISCFNIILKYDKNIMYPVSYIKGNLFSEMISTLDSSADMSNYDEVKFIWDSINDIDYTGTLFTVRFKIKESAINGKYPINVNDSTTMFTNSKLNDIKYSYEAGSITVSDMKMGDVNKDGVINGKDIVLLRQYVAGWPTAVFDNYQIVAADVTGDGVVNGKDIVKIRQFIAGWPGVIL